MAVLVQTGASRGRAQTISEAFSRKIGLVLKALSTTRGQLASDLGVDKSVVGKWLTGAATPSAYNMSRLSQLIARSSPGFSNLDWERDLDGLTDVLGVSRTIESGGTCGFNTNCVLTDRPL